MTILYVVLGLIAVVLLVAALLPSKGVISRSILINRPAEQVYGYIYDFKNYVQWNPWSQMEPDAKNVVSSPSAGVGATWEWKGKKVGHGKMTTEMQEPSRSIRNRVEFFKPFQGIAIDRWDFESRDGGTFVTWGYEGENKYPVGRLMWGLMVQRQLNGQYEKGLAELKRRLEA